MNKARRAAIKDYLKVAAAWHPAIRAGKVTFSRLVAGGFDLLKALDEAEGQIERLTLDLHHANEARERAEAEVEKMRPYVVKWIAHLCGNEATP